jgi:hypothetical protein
VRRKHLSRCSAPIWKFELTRQCCRVTKKRLSVHGRSALDQIYYYNAYRAPPNYRPKSETEKALQDSLRDMEIQCKDRVDLLEALRRSRLETKKGKESSSDGETVRGRPSAVRTPRESMEQERKGFLGQGTVPAVDYPDLSRRPPPLPQRPAMSRRKSSELQTSRSHSVPRKAHQDQACLFRRLRYLYRQSYQGLQVRIRRAGC